MPPRPLLISSHRPHHRFLSGPPKHSLRKALLIPIIAIVAITLLIAIVLVLFFVVRCYRRRKQQVVSRKPGAEGDDPGKLHRYKYWQLKRATKSFSQNRKLGKGGFGVVYRGLLSSGKEVAVKKLDLLSLQGEREFQNELFICSGLDSPYVVSLLGYCTHGKRLRLLVYECMQNRSLQEALFEKGYPERLDWKKRFKIIGDTARALEFLHVGCNPPIIHGDVKPSNILLDRNFSARIADFGLARFKTENLGSESARYSASSEKLKQPETPERLRYGPLDHASPGTPEMSRSSTSRDPFSDCSCKVADSEFANKIQSLNKEATPALDTILSDRLCEIDTAASGEAFPSSPSWNHATGHLEHTSSVAGVSELPIIPTNEKDYGQRPGKGMLNGHVNDQALDIDISVGSNKAVLEDNVSPVTRSPIKTELSSKKKGTTDALWRKEGESAQSAGEEYVLDWLGSELHANGQADNTRAEAVSPSQKSSKPHGQKSRLGVVETQVEEVKKERKKVKVPSKKGREWWKDEYFAELSGKCEPEGKKRNRNKSIENWKDYLSAELTSVSGELRTDTRSTKMIGKCSSKEWYRNTRSGELSFSGAMERQRVPSIISDMCSEDRRCHFSSELINGHWSGELTKSGELVSKDASSTTSMRGTVCYVAPEYGGSGILSEKSDIYSFGVLMLVILSGRRPIQVSAAPMKEFERANLISWARNLSQNGKLLDLMDEGLCGEYDHEEAVLCITLALLCLQRVPSTRPHISEIVKILSREMAVPNLPLELSPSPPARIPYKIMNRSPKVHHAHSNSITSSKEAMQAARYYAYGRSQSLSESPHSRRVILDSVPP
ncbi:hypothetical protein GOP47_0030317 [Adiantum capillus-veneris]|nr:hypothetical protein GOP47_0030317 [Adiantum capillus-veneris]